MPDEKNEMFQRITRVETKLDIMNSTRETAQEALLSTKASHRRLDELREEIAAMKQAQRWLIGIAISAAGFALAVAGFLLKVVNG
ncbi:hypothetical protein [Paenibacillus sp. MBLB4367]|uniref:hypothetical protein n=1 Tax=Paenibacillus sp. MBLB4367 TaxID=3384767 RepID=UPI003907F3B4